MKLLQNKKGLIMGVANERSIAWGIAQKLSEHGAELAFTYVGDALKKRVVPLAESLGSTFTLDCNVENKDQIVQTFSDIKKKWSNLDFVIHAIAFSDKSELSGESTKVIPNYNVMGVCKSALETSTKYLARDLGGKGIRVNAISAGPIKTLAASAIGDAKFLYKWNADHSLLKRNVDIHDVGNSAVYLVSDLSGGVTGEIHYVDAGYNKVGMPDPKNITS